MVKEYNCVTYFLSMKLNHILIKNELNIVNQCLINTKHIYFQNKSVVIIFNKIHDISKKYITQSIILYYKKYKYNKSQ